ncbi:hypothetical protein TraAM80_06942 [Trypanosoma rangeli]|uniref:Uncharacterized protein n=1 Tax=Trypanosoma rangeli TaxID=5698 RepID=A0A422N7U0_TRYRA|nr:uncharacterized protein TraAM80_06942 [Trypanosoma rangeli]RNF01515.1 hypothetical protein TraAM80_06942 [Trypanosoma rangeli]|eukprot:RNF01515.1 hypothetical protein TraAM80_06942 [Trypanosoma rangeli]
MVTTHSIPIPISASLREPLCSVTGAALCYSLSLVGCRYGRLYAPAVMSARCTRQKRSLMSAACASRMLISQSVMSFFRRMSYCSSKVEKNVAVTAPTRNPAVRGPICVR